MALVQCDLGRRFPDSFQTKDDLETALPRARKHIRGILAPLGAKYIREQIQRRATHFLEQIQADNEEYKYPGAASDRLFHASYRHKHQRQEQCACCANCRRSSDLVCETSRGLSCHELGCDDDHLVARERLDRKRELEKMDLVREAQTPSIFLGRVGSGDTVLKSGEERDRLARQYNILSLEMEGAGIWEDLPCIVVKGVCDYADSHKNKQWQHFAAATAASVVKALLERYIQTR
ncbi:zinc finger protein [Beauveria brongniartii RCEF 3172]|uniref:Zinc finger protein n=1 Tax=Beauveria brongniartii RCEF 3172 TaxID=1081107 RepID=A0A166Z3Y4_9HYPO|nr:zinc finger protein [Beauveria brongniartii RCEF 3172]